MPNQPILNIHPPTAQVQLDQEPSQIWHLPNQAPWCKIYREGDAYRLRFPGFADFIAHRHAEVECHPVAGTDQATLEHLYLNQVLPAVLGLLDRPFFHASCVAMDGAAIAFVGGSGRGKSTLATYLGLQGHPLLTDDGVELRWSNGRCMARPTHPAIRLWDDSSNALLPDNVATLPPISYTTKGRYPSDGLMPFAEQPVPLRRAYFLGDGSAEAVTITRLHSHAAHVAWVEHSPMLDTKDKQRLKSQFEQVTCLVSMDISYALDYPRRYEALPAVVEALRNHLAADPVLHYPGDD